jgi:hypothetical protein
MIFGIKKYPKTAALDQAHSQRHFMPFHIAYLPSENTLPGSRRIDVFANLPR